MTDAVKFAPGAALTFDDVLLLPAHSAIMPGESGHDCQAQAAGSP